MQRRHEGENHRFSLDENGDPRDTVYTDRFGIPRAASADAFLRWVWILRLFWPARARPFMQAVG
jgi:hypothetical protein